jgi:hypothetical protein
MSQASTHKLLQILNVSQKDRKKNGPRELNTPIL